MESKVFPKMNTLVKMRESTLLSKQQNLELINAENFETALSVLTGTKFFTFARLEHLADLESALEIEKYNYINWGKELSPDIPVAEIFEVADTIHNLKVFLREHLIGSELNYKNEFAHLYFKIQGSDKPYFNLLNFDISKLSLYELSLKNVIEYALNDYTVNKSFLKTDLIFTFFGHKQLLSFSEKIGDPRITDFIKAYIDLDLLSILFQTRENSISLNKGVLSKAVAGNLNPEWLFSASIREQDDLISNTPYSEFWAALKDKSIQGLSEVYMDNYLLNICKKAKLEAFGVYPIFAFLYAKLLDIKNVRIIFALKKSKANNHEIEERLREEYGL